MATIRGVKDRRFKFVQLLNSMFEDPELSLKAKGFIGYCLTKTSDWEFHISHLSSVLKEGERAIYSTIDECEELGYAFRWQPRKENGDFDSWETVISDSKDEISLLKEELKNNPHFQKSFTDRRFADAQSADAQSVGPLYSNTDCLGIRKGKEYEQQQQGTANLPECEAAPSPFAAAAQENSSENEVSSEAEICYETTRAEKRKISVKEIYRSFCNKPYSTAIVKQAIEQFRRERPVVNNFLKFLESVCERLEKSGAKPEKKSQLENQKPEMSPAEREEYFKNLVSLGDFEKKKKENT